MPHHTKFCKWIHGVFVLSDHALGTNLKVICVVFLYYTDGKSVRCPIDFRIFYQEKSKPKWLGSRKSEYKAKYGLAVGMPEQALKIGFPKCIVLADSWFGTEPFVKELKRLKLGYVLEIISSRTVRQPCKTPRLTPTGRLARKQYDVIKLPKFFKSIESVVKCGFASDKEMGKKEKIPYHTKIATVRSDAISGKHRIIGSVDPNTQSSKYLFSDQLTWEATKILTTYHYRWIIEEFFKNAKQLTDMEGATVRSEQGVTLSLCLVSWIDFLLHFENYRFSTVGKLTQESSAIPSIVRQAQYDNTKAFPDRVQNDEEFV